MSNEDKGSATIEISFQKAVAVLAGAILASIVSTAFAVIRVGNSDHFLLMALNTEVAAIQQSRSELVPRFLVLEEQSRQTQEDISEIKQDTKDIKNYLNVR